MTRRPRSSDSANCPYPAIGGFRILQFAAIRKPVRYSGRSGLFIVREDGCSEEVGPVPRLAIGVPLWRERDVAILHCKRTWEIVGVQAGFKSVQQAEARADRMYPGVSNAWVDAHVSISEAKEFERIVWHSFRCSFCGRIPPEQLDPDAARISGKDALICAECVRKFYHELELNNDAAQRPNFSQQQSRRRTLARA